MKTEFNAKAQRRKDARKTKIHFPLAPLRLCAFALILLPGICRADLSAIVSPGYTWRAGERADTAKLNRAANPTITITGTVGGTNANIAANSVNGTMLVTGLPGSNLTWDASSPRKLVIKDAGVDTNQISSGIAGSGLAGGSGSPLAVQVDTNTISIGTNRLTLNLITFSNLVNTLATSNALYQVTNAAAGSSYGWAKFPGTNLITTYSPVAGYNVSNIVRTAIGQYTVNFTNSMLTTNYAIMIQIMDANVRYVAPNVAVQSSNKFTLNIVDNSGNTFADPQYLYIQLMR